MIDPPAAPLVDSFTPALSLDVPLLGRATQTTLPPGLPNGSVARALWTTPGKFDFFEAVLLLQQFAAEHQGAACEPIGRFAQPSREAVRFTVPNDAIFPASAVQSVAWAPATGQSTVAITFLGLTGPSGVLPRCYTENVARIDAAGRHAERHALRDWLDRFNHRLASLFFEAWAKYRFPVSFRRRLEPAAAASRQPMIRVALAAIAGLDPPHRLPASDVAEAPDAASAAATTSGTTTATGDRGRVDRNEWLGLAGLLAQRPMNVVNLQHAAQRSLGVPVRVKQFAGCWLDLDQQSRTRLGETATVLGRHALLGERIWSRQQKLCIEVGPLDADGFAQFLPPTPGQPGEGYRRLSELVRTCIGESLEFDVCLRLQADEVPPPQLNGDASATRLGLNSWLGQAAGETVLDDAVFNGVNFAEASPTVA